MGRKPKNKPIKTSSLSDENEVKEAADTPAPKVEKEIPLTPQEVAKEAKPQKVISPLLAEGVEVKAHAMGIGPGEGGSNIENLKVDNDFFSTQPVNPTLTKADLMSEKKPVTPPPAAGGSAIPPLPPMKPDVPEQSFNPNPGGEPIPVPDNISRQAASELADTIMSMYERIVPEMSHEYSKLNVKEIKKLEASGDLLFGSYNDVVEQNKENKRELEKRAHDDAALIKKPLKKLLEVKQINAPPHIELLIILVFVALTYFMMVRGIKKSNEDLLNRLYEKINKDKAGSGAVKNPESDIPMAETETVVK